MVSSEASAAKLRKKTGAPESAVVALDAVAGEGRDDALREAFAGADAVVMLVSAVPQLKKRSLLPFLVRNKILGDKKVRLGFRWKRGQTPQQVDYEAGVAQIDAAAAAGVRKLVWVGSMGGTQEDNFLNTIADGNILMWKRKAEIYLSKKAELDWSIIHPGGLTKGEPGEREIVVGVDDELLKRKSRSIPRADVARVVVECIDAPEASNKAFDVCTNPPEETTAPTADVAALLADIGTCDYTIAVPEL